MPTSTVSTTSNIELTRADSVVRKGQLPSASATGQGGGCERQALAGELGPFSRHLFLLSEVAFVRFGHLLAQELAQGGGSSLTPSYDESMPVPEVVQDQSGSTKGSFSASSSPFSKSWLMSTDRVPRRGARLELKAWVSAIPQLDGARRLPAAAAQRKHQPKGRGRGP